jgi:hypothetical protein
VWRASQHGTWLIATYPLTRGNGPRTSTRVLFPKELLMDKRPPPKRRGFPHSPTCWGLRLGLGPTLTNLLDCRAYLLEALWVACNAICPTSHLLQPDRIPCLWWGRRWRGWGGWWCGVVGRVGLASSPALQLPVFHPRRPAPFSFELCNHQRAPLEQGWVVGRVL